MLIEREIEEKIAQKLSEVVDDMEIVTSWAPVNDGLVKGETSSNKLGVISLFIMPKTHDAFSLPTCNIRGELAIEIKSEKSPTMAKVSDVYDKVQQLFSLWHYDSQTFTQQTSATNFFCAALNITGSDKVQYDRAAHSWIVSLQFNIRGTELFDDEGSSENI